MHDPWNPTEDEVRAWAYDAGTLEPEQDWHLALPDTGFEELYLDLVADPACPKHDYFLWVLYLLVGDAVRSGYRATPRERVGALLDAARARRSPELELWTERSRALMARPDIFDYDLWCGGGLARTPRE